MTNSTANDPAKKPERRAEILYWVIVYGSFVIVTAYVWFDWTPLHLFR